MDKEITMTLRSLKVNHFQAIWAEDRETAKKAALSLIPQEAVVGAGDSTTLRQIGLYEALVQRGTKLINPYVPELTAGGGRERFQELARKTLGNDFFLAGTNAVTMDGKLVNIDRMGNRVSGMIFGAPDVILVVGRNKIVRNVNDALDRIKNVIAPAHAKRRGRKTPCATLSRCTECKSEDRLCNITTIIEKKPFRTNMTVIMVNEDLGLGWDPCWPDERIEKIRAAYYEFTWSFPTFPQPAHAATAG